MLNKTIEDNIVIVTLENGKYNTVTLETLRMLNDIIDEVNTKDELKGIVLTGSGRFFSSGFDLPMFLAMDTREKVHAFFEEEEEILLKLFMCRKPVICAMNGHSAAMGMIMAMAADYRLVVDHPKVKLGMSEIKIGLALTITEAEVMRFGLDTDKKWRDVMYFGNMMNPEAAKSMEIVDEVVAAEDLVARAKELVALWIDTPGRPFITMKQLLKGNVEKRVRELMADGTWKQGLECFFDKDVRAALEFTHAMMAG